MEDINFNKNEDHNKLLISELRSKLAVVKLGGGKSRIEKHHSKGKLTARERIDYLLDSKGNSVEIGAFAGEGMYAGFFFAFILAFFAHYMIGDRQQGGAIAALILLVVSYIFHKRSNKQ